MRDHLRSHKNIVFTIAVVGAVIFLDRISKLFFSNILSPGESIPVLRNIFHFTLVHNTGIAFGLLRNQGIVFILIPIITLALVVFVIYYFRRNKKTSFLYVLAFSLILGGAIGNLIDRMAFGYVIDFIDFRVWPVFNLADSVITIGTVILLITCIPLSAK